MRTFRGIVFAAAALAFVPATQAVAQDSECRLLRFRTNFRLNGAQRYLETYERAQHADQKRTALDNAHRVLNEAVENPAGADPFTMWYFFGKVYAGRGDLAGADSSWAKATTLGAADAG